MKIKIPEKVKEVQNYKLKQEPGTKSISFSQLSTYLNCPKCWERMYLRKESVYKPSINATFGTAFHETLQNWLDILYNKSVKAANEVDLGQELENNLRKCYIAEREKNGGQNYSDAATMTEFLADGKEILDYIVKHRKTSFPSNRSNILVGCEIPIYTPLWRGLYFKGFIDILTYDLERNIWKIWDIKTSTRGWKDEKLDFVKTSQILLYKEFLSKQFDIPIETIEAEYFIVKRKIIVDAEFAAMRRRVQEFVPNDGPRIHKKVVGQVDQFICEALTPEGDYVDKNYPMVPTTKNCRYCLFRESCPAASAVL